MAKFVEHEDIARQLRTDRATLTIEAEHRLMRAFAHYYPSLTFLVSDGCSALPAGKAIHFESARYDRANELFVVGFEVEGEGARAWLPIQLFDDLVDAGEVAILR